MDAILDLAPRGQHDHRQRRPSPAAALEDLEAALAGEHQVEHDRVEAPAQREPLALDAVEGGLDVEALGLQAAAQEVDDPGLVLDHQDACRIGLMAAVAAGACPRLGAGAPRSFPCSHRRIGVARGTSLLPETFHETSHPAVTGLLKRAFAHCLHGRDASPERSPPFRRHRGPASRTLAGRRNQRQRAPHGCHRRGADRAAGRDRRHDHQPAATPVGAPVHRDAADRAGVAEAGEHRLPLHPLLHADAAYRRKGPPPGALRALAPLLVLSTVVVFASGVALLFVGPVVAIDAPARAQGELHRVAGGDRRCTCSRTCRRFRQRCGPTTPAGTSSGPHSPDARAATSRSRPRSPLGVALAVLTIPEFGPWMHTHLGHDH